MDTSPEYQAFLREKGKGGSEKKKQENLYSPSPLRRTDTHSSGNMQDMEAFTHFFYDIYIYLARAKSEAPINKFII